jgi:carboxyl-terminal processing protease
MTMTDISETKNQDEGEVYVRAGKRRVPLWHIRNLVLGFTILIVGFGSGYAFSHNQDALSITPRIISRPSGLDRGNLDFTLFWDVWDRLERNYLDPEMVDPQQMVYGAISGMTAALGDPYTVFLPPQDNQAAKEDLNGEFDGVGIQLGYKQGTLAVMTPLEGHPAIKQGVRAGDLILNIKDEGKDVDQDTNGMSLTEAVKLIRGKKGTNVTLTLFREERGRFDITIARQTIQIPGVELEFGQLTDSGWEKDEAGNVAWLKVRRFGERTDDEFADSVSQILAKRKNLVGVVLDLRNNPGGYLNSAVTLASEFIAEGLVVEQQGRFDKQSFKVNKRGRLIGTPTVVLINGGSASASEILAGALRDRLQVKLVGEKSFGKGTVQEAIDMKDKAGLHVTIARWVLPGGDWIHDTGLTPDVEVALEEPDTATEGATTRDTQLEKAVETLLE